MYLRSLQKVLEISLCCTGMEGVEGCARLKGEARGGVTLARDSLPSAGRITHPFLYAFDWIKSQVMRCNLHAR
jgi:hypothetical protein